MTNLTETANWDAGVYQFATTDPIQGGPGGIDNQPHQNMTNRLLWLRQRIAAAIAQAGQADGTTDNQQLAEVVMLHCPTISSVRALPIPTVPNTTQVVVHTRGSATVGDGLAQAFMWVYNANNADDGLNVLTPNSAPATGRWIWVGVNAYSLAGIPGTLYATAAELVSAVAPLAPINSPSFTNSATAYTPPAGDSSTRIATTQFVANGFTTKSGVSLTWNGDGGTYYKIATLPPSSASTADSINIRATLNTGYSAGNCTIFDGIIGNRNGFSFNYALYGPNFSATRIIGFLETDGSVSVYAFSSSTFAYAYLTLSNIGVQGITGPPATLYPNPGAFSSPTGTLVFDTGNPATYQPSLWVSAPGAYLTSAIAAATYLPLSGGTLTGNLIVNSDIHCYRAGGTTGAIFLDQGGTHYLYFDGVQYNLPNAQLFVQGQQVAALNSPAFVNNPTCPTPSVGDSSALLANTQFVKNVFANSPTIGGNPNTTTQAANDNSTHLATTQYVDRAIAAQPLHQKGVVAVAAGAQTTTVNFPTAYGAGVVPVVTVTPYGVSSAWYLNGAPTNTGFQIISNNGGAINYGWSAST